MANAEQQLARPVGDKQQFQFDPDAEGIDIGIAQLDYDQVAKFGKEQDWQKTTPGDTIGNLTVYGLMADAVEQKQGSQWDELNAKALSDLQRPAAQRESIAATMRALNVNAEKLPQEQRKQYLTLGTALVHGDQAALQRAFRSATVDENMRGAVEALNNDLRGTGLSMHYEPGIIVPENGRHIPALLLVSNENQAIQVSSNGDASVMRKVDGRVRQATPDETPQVMENLASDMRRVTDRTAAQVENPEKALAERNVDKAVQLIRDGKFEDLNKLVRDLAKDGDAIGYLQKLMSEKLGVNVVLSPRRLQLSYRQHHEGRPVSDGLNTNVEIEFDNDGRVKQGYTQVSGGFVGALSKGEFDPDQATKVVNLHIDIARKQRRLPPLK